MNLVFAIHGILTRQTIADWPDKFDAWCATHAPTARVLKREYLAAPLPLWNLMVRNPLLARACEAEALEFMWPGERPRLHFVAHSNGTDVALRTIKRLAARGIITDTLIATGSVLDSDIDRNGVADLLADGLLRRAVAYSSYSDMAISLGCYTSYGDLGVRGWTEDGDQHPDVRIGDGLLVTRWFTGYGHGDYFAEKNRARTFATIKEDLCL